MCAAYSGSAPTLQALLKAGAELDIKDKASCHQAIKKYTITTWFYLVPHFFVINIRMVRQH
jgi:hypothetical protein